MINIITTKSSKSGPSNVGTSAGVLSAVHDNNSRVGAGRRNNNSQANFLSQTWARQDIIKGEKLNNKIHNTGNIYTYYKYSYTYTSMLLVS